MSNLEKINIYVPNNIAEILDQDAWLFEIYNPQKTRINRNRFLSLLLVGYYNTYITERHSALQRIKTEMESLQLSESDLAEISTNILNRVVLPEVPKRKGKKPAHLSLKPTSETEGIILSIMKEISQFDFISQYLCKMFMSYVHKPLYEREQIVFNQNYDILKDACTSHRSISFTTTWNSKVVHEVYPYRMSIGKDEMFNYLLCQELNYQGIPEARTYRLSRFSHLNYSTKAMVPDSVVIRHLEKMQHYGAQFPINNDEIVCVKLNKYGILSYNRVYHGRPKPIRIEDRNDGQLYYFDCSRAQIIQYFRKFEAGAVIVLSPEDLRDEIISFHKKALEDYSDLVVKQ